MLVPAATTHEAVMAVVKQAKPANLERVELFDVFRGKNVPEGQKSLAFALTYRSAERTLTDAAGQGRGGVQGAVAGDSARLLTVGGAREISVH